MTNELDNTDTFTTKNYSKVLVRFDLLDTLQGDLHLYSRNYLGCTGSELVDFYVQGQLGTGRQDLLPKKITRNDVLEFFRVKRDQEHFSEIFSFTLLQKYQDFFDLQWETPSVGRSVPRIKTSKMTSIGSLQQSVTSLQEQSRQAQAGHTINRIFFFFRHSTSCFAIDQAKVLECYNHANEEERLILVKKRLVVLKYKAEQEYSKKRKKQRKIEQIARRLRESHSVQYLSGKMNSFFERGLYEKYRKDYEEELVDLEEGPGDSAHPLTLGRGKKSHFQRLEESKLDIFDSNLEASLFQQTLRSVKRTWKGKNIRRHKKWGELKTLVTKTIDEAYQSFFDKPNMFLFLKKSSYTLFPQILQRSVFYLECYHKYRCDH